MSETASPTAALTEAVAELTPEQRGRLSRALALAVVEELNAMAARARKEGRIHVAPDDIRPAYSQPIPSLSPSKRCGSGG